MQFQFEPWHMGRLRNHEETGLSIFLRQQSSRVKWSRKFIGLFTTWRIYVVREFKLHVFSCFIIHLWGLLCNCLAFNAFWWAVKELHTLIISSTPSSFILLTLVNKETFSSCTSNDLVSTEEQAFTSLKRRVISCVTGVLLRRRFFFSMQLEKVLNWPTLLSWVDNAQSYMFSIYPPSASSAESFSKDVVYPFHAFWPAQLENFRLCYCYLREAV
jgi:hypothetical protein